MNKTTMFKQQIVGGGIKYFNGFILCISLILLFDSCNQDEPLPMVVWGFEQDSLRMNYGDSILITGEFAPGDQGLTTIELFANDDLLASDTGNTFLHYVKTLGPGDYNLRLLANTNGQEQGRSSIKVLTVDPTEFRFSIQRIFPGGFSRPTIIGDTVKLGLRTFGSMASFDLESVTYYRDDGVLATFDDPDQEAIWVASDAGEFSFRATLNDINDVPFNSIDEVEVVVQQNTPPVIDVIRLKNENDQLYDPTDLAYVPGEALQIMVDFSDEDGNETLDRMELRLGEALLDVSEEGRFQYDLIWEEAVSGDHDLEVWIFDIHGGSDSARVPVHIPAGIFAQGSITDITSTDDRFYALDNGANAMLVIDATTKSVIRSVPLGIQNPVGVEVVSSLNRAYITSEFSGSLLVVDLSDYSIRSIEFDPNAGGGPLVYSSPANRLFVTTRAIGRERALYSLNLETEQFSFLINSRELDFLATSPTDKWLFTTSKGISPATIHRYEIAQDTILLAETDRPEIGTSSVLSIGYDGEKLLRPFRGLAIDPLNFTNILGEWIIDDRGRISEFLPDHGTGFVYAINGNFIEKGFLYQLDYHSFSLTGKIPCQFADSNYRDRIMSISKNDQVIAICGTNAFNSSNHNVILLHDVSDFEIP